MVYKDGDYRLLNAERLFIKNVEIGDAATANITDGTITGADITIPAGHSLTILDGEFIKSII